MPLSPEDSLPEWAKAYYYDNFVWHNALGPARSLQPNAWYLFDGIKEVDKYMIRLNNPNGALMEQWGFTGWNWMKDRNSVPIGIPISETDLCVVWKGPGSSVEIFQIGGSYMKNTASVEAFCASAKCVGIPMDSALGHKPKGRTIDMYIAKPVAGGATTSFEVKK